jgi:uncharacterized membrane protein
MNLAHVHLLLNHFPIVGSIIGIFLFFAALLAARDELKQVALVLFLTIALLSIPTYLSGNAAESTIKDLPGVSETLIQRHQDAALLAYLFVEITGAVAWFGLWQFRRTSHFRRGVLTSTLVLSMMTVILMVNAGNLGGQIRHSEILPQIDPSGVISAQWTLGLSTAKVGKFVTGVKWVWPTLQTLHFMGLTILMGVVFIVDLRILGAMKNVSFVAVHRLLPWGILGFGLNLFTGMCYFIAAPFQYTHNPTFYWKIALVMLAGANAIYFTVFDEPWKLMPGGEATLKSKTMALSAVVLWIGVVFCGLMLPFLGNAF